MPPKQPFHSLTAWFEPIAHTGSPARERTRHPDPLAASFEGQCGKPVDPVDVLSGPFSRQFGNGLSRGSKARPIVLGRPARRRLAHAAVAIDPLILPSLVLRAIP